MGGFSGHPWGQRRGRYPEEMLTRRRSFIGVFALTAAAILTVSSASCRAQSALLLEQPYGFFGLINPTGHNAIYLRNVCAATPVKLRRCHAGELGVVIARYKGIDGYDWIAIPLVPYLYSVEDLSEVPARVSRESVRRMRERYREEHLEMLGKDLAPGNIMRDGWSELLGVAYERAIYAFRFETTPEQDDELIAKLNAGRNRSHFNLFFNNCADFARRVLDVYFPHAFGRSIFPDAGITTPKHVAHKLVKYARKHRQLDLVVFKISQVPGYRRNSDSNKSIDESFVTTPYVIPITLLNPYVAAGLAVDYLVRGRYRLFTKRPEVLGSGNLSILTVPAAPGMHSASAAEQAANGAAGTLSSVQTTNGAGSGSGESETTSE